MAQLKEFAIRNNVQDLPRERDGADASNPKYLNVNFVAPKIDFTNPAHVATLEKAATAEALVEPRFTTRAELAEYNARIAQSVVDLKDVKDALAAASAEGEKNSGQQNKLVTSLLKHPTHMSYMLFEKGTPVQHGDDPAMTPVQITYGKDSYLIYLNSDQLGYLERAAERGQFSQKAASQPTPVSQAQVKTTPSYNDKVSLLVDLASELELPNQQPLSAKDFEEKMINKMRYRDPSKANLIVADGSLDAQEIAAYVGSKAVTKGYQQPLEEALKKAGFTTSNNIKVLDTNDVVMTSTQVLIDEAARGRN